jgi:replicative DNA helicase
MGMAAYKESGIIEYTADVLIGLNFKDLEAEENADGDKRKPQRKDPLKIRQDNDRKKKAAQPIEITFRVLKNRNGLTGKTDLLFISMFNHFEEAPKEKVKERVQSFAKAFGGTVKEIDTDKERQELAELFGS